MGFVSLTISSNLCALFPAIPQDNPAFPFIHGNSRKPASITLCHFVYSTGRKPIHPSWKTTEHPTALPALHRYGTASGTRFVPKSDTKLSPSSPLVFPRWQEAISARVQGTGLSSKPHRSFHPKEH